MQTVEVVVHGIGLVVTGTVVVIDIELVELGVDTKLNGTTLISMKIRGG